MASPTRELMEKGPRTNMDVDYVISFRYATTDKAKAVARFEKLVESLASVGLATESRVGDSHSLLVFVRVASEDQLFGEVYRSRANDWIHGIRSAAPEKDTKKSLEAEPLHQAERLRLIHRLITNPVSEGGAGITPKHGEWENVESIFALQDYEYNKHWIMQMSKKWMLEPSDLDEIRDRLGEKIAFYFAFTQSYFTFLTIPAAIGVSSWLFLGTFSPVYAFAASLWTIIFIEYWKHQEYDLAIRWGVHGVSKIQQRRHEFEHEQETTDPVTGETVQIFPATKRLQRQLLQIPFAIAASLALGTLIAFAFGIEIFITEVYDGPFKSVLAFLPTGILTTLMPVLTGIFTSFAARLTKYENYETHAAYSSAMTQKIFVLNFITSYLGIFLTAFVYVPFAKSIVPYLDIFSVTVRPFAENEKQMQTPSPAGFQINPDRLRKQVIYFVVTAQIVNFAMEVIVPYVKRQGFMKYKQMQTDRAAKRGGAAPDPTENDIPEEAAFLHRVRNEVTLTEYDVTDDLREMVLQFGYLSLFSVVWPVTGLSFLINNWIELRADAVKICVEMQRPTPERADTIGPWLDSLGFLSWLGSVTTAALCYMFSNDGMGPRGTPTTIKGWGLLLSILFAEHLYLLIRWAASVGIGKIDTPGRQKERQDQFMTRKMYFQESLTVAQPDSIPTSEKISRASLEEEARAGSLKSARIEDRFWARQRNWRETATIGSRVIEQAAPEAKKTQ